MQKSKKSPTVKSPSAITISDPALVSAIQRVAEATGKQPEEVAMRSLDLGCRSRISRPKEMDTLFAWMESCPPVDNWLDHGVKTLQIELPYEVWTQLHMIASMRQCSLDEAFDRVLCETDFYDVCQDKVTNPGD